MKIDLHIHTKTGSDGNLTVREVFQEAKNRRMDCISITDHDSVDAQDEAVALAPGFGIQYITGVELNVMFEYPGGKPVSLDFLGYAFDHKNSALHEKLQIIRSHRENRAWQILQNLNFEFEKENIRLFTQEDLRKIQESVDGAFGRPHIANYLVSKGIVGTRQEAFDKYLVKCDVPKYPLSLGDASSLIRNAGGVIILAHPGDPNGTSLVKVSQDVRKQTSVIQQYMLDYIDGIECWHSRHNPTLLKHYTSFAKRHNLIMTGGSDCHQKPVIIGTPQVPDDVVKSLQSKVVIINGQV